MDQRSKLPAAQLVTPYEIRDRAGSILAVHVRTDHPDGHKSFRWEKPDGTLGLGGRPLATLPPYGIWRLADFDRQEPVYLTEGEKAADALNGIGLLALGTVTGASSTPDDEALSSLAGREVRLWPDNDRIGHDHMNRIFDILLDLGAAPVFVDWSEAPEGGDASDFVAAGQTVVDVLALLIRSAPLRVEHRAEGIRATSNAPAIHSAQGSIQTGAERILRFQTAREFAASMPAEIEWIAKPWVAVGAITGVDGKIKAAGKTTWVMYLSRATVDGRPFLGEPTRRTAVVYLTEQPRTSLLASLARADLLGRDDFTLLTWRDSTAMAWPEVVAAAVRECEARSAGLLVIDTLSRFAAIDGDGENDAGKADAAMAPLQIAAADGLAVIVVRHERKAGGDVGDSGRGSTAFGGATDIILAIRRTEAGGNVRKIHALSRFDETPDALVIELTDAGYVVLGDDAAVALRAIQGKLRDSLPWDESRGLSIQELVAKLDASRTTVQRAIDSLIEAGEVGRAGTGHKGDPYLYALLKRSSDGPNGRTSWTLPWRDDRDDDDYVVGTA